ncbi:DUF5374 domain-containing protein [Haemophilus pittmaniae]|nr:DUF5374 domain-containing protein [Haemophilus pittmaniae]SNV79068.1 Putative type II secretory pathway, pseudopilin [Haemophilus pittmaniae]
MMLKIKPMSGHGLLGLLYALAISAFLILLFSHWSSGLNYEAMRRYQHNQAIEIAENQLNRRWAGMRCENALRENSIEFQISCTSDDVMVKYPLGEFRFKNR